MVSTMQQHEHSACASHATRSELTLAVCAVLCEVMRAAVRLLQKPSRCQPQSVAAQRR